MLKGTRPSKVTKEINHHDRQQKSLPVPGGLYLTADGRAGEIRTHDLLHPMQAFYQAELQPAVRQDGESGEMSQRIKLQVAKVKQQPCSDVAG